VTNTPPGSSSTTKRTIYSSFGATMAVATLVSSLPDHPHSLLFQPPFIWTRKTTDCDDNENNNDGNIPSESQPQHPPPSISKKVQEMPKEKVARIFRKRTTLQVASEVDNNNNDMTTTRTPTKATTSTTTTTTTTNQQASQLSQKKGLLQRLSTLQELNKLRTKEKEMIQRWEKDEEDGSWRELPARAWPAYQPTPKQLEGIMQNITIHNCDLRATNTICDLSDYVHLPHYIQRCTDWMFQMATTLVFYNMDPPAGLAQFQRLAQRGHVDSMVACGIILVEGLGVPPNEKEGLEWLEKAVKRGSAQGFYELGTVYYTGIDGVVDEDVVKAFALFEKAAEQDHTAAIYMVADCLVEGEGTERSVARAVPLFYKAAERGHRFSRQRIRELLARVDYPL
jgi:hypothetical protein